MGISAHGVVWDLVCCAELYCGGGGTEGERNITHLSRSMRYSSASKKATQSCVSLYFVKHLSKASRCAGVSLPHASRSTNPDSTNGASTSAMSVVTFTLFSMIPIVSTPNHLHTSHKLCEHGFQNSRSWALPQTLDEIHTQCPHLETWGGERDVFREWVGQHRIKTALRLAPDRTVQRIIRMFHSTYERV